MEKVQSETWVGAMTPEQILELAHEAGFPRDTIFYRSDQFITFAQAVAQRTREECAAAIPTTRNEVQLMCGELNSGEWRTVSAMLSAVQRQIRSMKAAYLAGQASVEERVKELEQERDEAVRQWERFERMAGDNWAALKAQAGEQQREQQLLEAIAIAKPVMEAHAGPSRLASFYAAINTHPTTERPYNPLNDYAVIPMVPTTEPVKAQAGEQYGQVTPTYDELVKQVSELNDVLGLENYVE